MTHFISCVIFQWWISCINSLAAYSSRQMISSSTLASSIDILFFFLFKIENRMSRSILALWINKNFPRPSAEFSQCIFDRSSSEMKRHARNLTHLQGNQRGGGFLVVHIEKKKKFFFKELKWRQRFRSMHRVTTCTSSSLHIYEKPVNFKLFPSLFFFCDVRDNEPRSQTLVWGGGLLFGVNDLCRPFCCRKGVFEKWVGSIKLSLSLVRNTHPKKWQGKRPFKETTKISWGERFTKRGMFSVCVCVTERENGTDQTREREGTKRWKRIETDRPACGSIGTTGVYSSPGGSSLTVCVCVRATSLFHLLIAGLHTHSRRRPFFLAGAPSSYP